MTSLEQLNKLVDFWISNKMPNEQIIYADSYFKERINGYFRGLASSGVEQATLKVANGSQVKADKINYGMFVIYVVDIDSL